MLWNPIPTGVYLARLLCIWQGWNASGEASGEAALSTGWEPEVTGVHKADRPTRNQKVAGISLVLQGAGREPQAARVIWARLTETEKRLEQAG